MSVKNFELKVELKAISTELITPSKSGRGMGRRWTFIFKSPVWTPPDPPDLTMILPKTGRKSVRSYAVGFTPLPRTKEGSTIIVPVTGSATEFDKIFPDSAEFAGSLECTAKAGTYDDSLSVTVVAVGGDSGAKTRITFLFSMVVAEQNAVQLTSDDGDGPPIVTLEPPREKRLEIRFTQPTSPGIEYAQITPFQRDEAARAVNTMNEAFRDFHKFLQDTGAIKKTLPNGKPNPAYDLPPPLPNPVKDGKATFELDDGNRTYDTPSGPEVTALTEQQRAQLKRLMEVINKQALALNRLKKIKRSTLILQAKPSVAFKDKLWITLINAEKSDVARPVKIEVFKNDIRSKINTPVVAKGDVTVAKLNIASTSSPDGELVVNPGDQLTGKVEIPLPETTEINGSYFLVGNYGECHIKATFVDGNGVAYEDTKIISYSGPFEGELRDAAIARHAVADKELSFLDSVGNNIVNDSLGQTINAIVDSTPDAPSLLVSLFPWLGNIVENLIRVFGNGLENTVQTLLAIFKGFFTGFILFEKGLNDDALKSDLENAERFPEEAPVGKRETKN